jgi:hypothetical protein
VSTTSPVDTRPHSRRRKLKYQSWAPYRRFRVTEQDGNNGAYWRNGVVYTVAGPIEVYSECDEKGRGYTRYDLRFYDRTHSWSERRSRTGRGLVLGAHAIARRWVRGEW